VQYEVPKPIYGSKLIYIASSDPQHLVNAVFLGSIEGLLKRLFELSGT